MVNKACDNKAEQKRARTPKRFIDLAGRKKLYTTNNPQEIINYFKEQEVLVSYKISGQPITLYYKEGFFQKADICNDSITGFDITKALTAMKQIPKKIPTEETFSVRGTAFFTWKDYNNLCCFYQDTDKIPLKPKEIVTSLLMKEDRFSIANFHLQFVAYDLFSKKEFCKKTDILKALKHIGFSVIHYEKFESVLKIEQLKNMRAFRNKYLYYPTKGLVFESESLNEEWLQPNERKTMAWAWPYDVNSKNYIGSQRLLGEFELLSNEN